MPSYKILENILQTIHSDFLKLDEEEVKETNLKLGDVIQQIVKFMREEDSLFDTMYQDIFYGGSFHDNLKIKHPDEFDIHLKLTLPSELHKVDIRLSNKPGFVWFKIFDNKSTEFDRFVGIKQYVESERVFNWFKGLVAKALQNINNPDISMNSESGPAITLKLKNQRRHVLIDLVPVFRFGLEKWPPKPFRQNDCNNNSNPSFFVVPKSCKNIPWGERYWRISFQSQERAIISGQERLKPALRLLKAIRDLYFQTISSYALKSMTLIALNAGDFSRNETLSDLLMALLFRFRLCLKYGIIRNYWYHRENLIKDINPETINDYYNLLDKRLRHIKGRFQKDPLIIARLILNEETGEYRKFVRDFLSN